MDPLLMNNPELKVALQVTDDLNLALMIRYYVIVTGDTLPGFNWTYGYGFVQEVRGYGADTMKKSNERGSRWVPSPWHHN